MEGRNQIIALKYYLTCKTTCGHHQYHHVRSIPLKIAQHRTTSYRVSHSEIVQYSKGTFRFHLSKDSVVLDTHCHIVWKDNDGHQTIPETNIEILPHYLVRPPSVRWKLTIFGSMWMYKNLETKIWQKLRLAESTTTFGAFRSVKKIRGLDFVPIAFFLASYTLAFSFSQQQ